MVTVSGAVTAPSGNDTVRPVSGIVMVPPETSMVFETLIGFLRSWPHQSAWNCIPVASVALPLTVPNGVDERSGGGGAATSAEQAAAIRTPNARSSDRKKLDRGIRDCRG